MYTKSKMFMSSRFRADDHNEKMGNLYIYKVATELAEITHEINKKKVNKIMI